MTMAARSEALAYRIWAYCEPREWDCTVREVSDALGVSAKRVASIAHHKGWTERLRVSGSDAAKELYFAHSAVSKHQATLTPARINRDTLRVFGIDA